MKTPSEHIAEGSRLDHLATIAGAPPVFGSLAAIYRITAGMHRAAAAGHLVNQARDGAAPDELSPRRRYGEAA